MYSKNIPLKPSISFILALVIFSCSTLPNLALSPELDPEFKALRGSNNFPHVKAPGDDDLVKACIDTKKKGSPFKIQLKDTERWISEMPEQPSIMEEFKEEITNMQFYSQLYSIKNTGKKTICKVDFELSLGNEGQYDIIGYTLLEKPKLAKRGDDNENVENLYFTATLPPAYTGPIPPKSTIPFAFTLGTQDVDVAPKELPEICIVSYQFCKDEDMTEPNPPLSIELIENEPLSKTEITTDNTLMNLNDKKIITMEPFEDYLSFEEKEEYEASVEEHLNEETKNESKDALDDDEAKFIAEQDAEDEDDDPEDDSSEDFEDDDNFANYKDDEYEYDRRH